jgi:Peptide N-acetyl-beta-D-glucosaminyl asparaginase amidase A
MEVTRQKEGKEQEMKASYWKAIVLAAGLILTAVCALGQEPLVIGSANTATADEPVPRPNTTPCTVPLFTNFVGQLPAHGTHFTPLPFSYTPPADCPGPWAKVVLVADFSVDAGRQLDRTMHIWIGAANLYYGTSMEPSANVARTMHEERDVTDYSALFKQPQHGQVTLNVFGTDPEIIGVKNTALSFGTAVLQFYPASASAPAPAVPDVVLPLSSDPVLGGQVFLGISPTVPNGLPNLTRTFSLPTNVERAFLDILARNTSEDEFDYLCLPDAEVANALETCNESSFREVEVKIDGQPAGVGPAYPRTTEGSIDPLLWRPTPGLQTLNFVPYRLDLTPFAGLLSNGEPHSVTIDVINAAPFAVNAALLLFLDHGSSHVTGGIELNTFTTANPVTKETKNTVNGTSFGTISIASAHQFKIRGSVNTSHGTVRTEMAQDIRFLNTQDFSFNPVTFTQNVKETLTLSMRTTTRTGNDDDEEHVSTRFHVTESPITVNLLSVNNPDGSLTQTATLRLQHNEKTVTQPGGDHQPATVNVFRNSMFTTDKVFFSPTFDIVRNQDQASTQELLTRDSNGTCFNRKITTANGILTRVNDGVKCRDNEDNDEDE